ncbi:hypothetical protein DMENIID0001_096630 [Sergentomyia squamirostris]
MPGRITDEQKYKLLALVKENFQVLFQLDTPAARDLQRQTWEHLATILNHLGGGVERNGKEWKNTFTQMKSTVKKKYNKVRKERRATGGGEIDPSLFLTEADHIIQEMFPASVTGISDTLELGFPDNESSDVFRAVSPISLRQSATHSNNTVGEEFRNTPVAGHSRWYDGDVGPNNSVAGHSRRNVGDVGPNPSVAGHSRRNDGDVGSNPNTPVAGHSIWYDGDVGPNTSVAGHSRRNVGDVGPNTSVAGHSRRNDGDVGSNPNTPVAGHSRWYDSDVGPNTSVAGQSRRNDGEVDQNSSESSSSSDLLQPDSTAVRQSHWNIHCSTAPSRQESIHDHSTATTATIETTGANRAMSEHSDSTGLPQSSSLPTNDLEANREHNSPPDAHERNTSGSFRRGSGPRRGGVDLDVEGRKLHHGYRHPALLLHQT